MKDVMKELRLRKFADKKILQKLTKLCNKIHKENQNNEYDNDLIDINISLHELSSGSE
jgi:hypothetical protein